MSIARTIVATTSALTPVRAAPRAHLRTVEVRIVVSGLEEDAFAASRADTLTRALAPILKHLDGLADVELVGVETGTGLLRPVERRQPLADLRAAIEFLGGVS